VTDRRDDTPPHGNAIDRRRLLRPLSTDAAARLKTVAGRSGQRPANEEPDPGAKTIKPGRADYLAVKAALHERLLDEIGERGLLDSDSSDVAAAVQDFAARAIESEDVPLNDPIFHTLLEVKKIPQVTSIRFWRATGGRTTSERGAESAVPHLRAIRDKHRNIIAVMTHNTDVSDSWEREGEDPEFFYQFSPYGYALGIDVLLYAMTH